MFIEKYCKSELKALKSFAEGLKRDIDAIENAVAYDYSNGFVEGTNSRLKMIKRTMYGRCRKRLLEAKLFSALSSLLQYFSKNKYNSGIFRFLKIFRNSFMQR